LFVRLGQHGPQFSPDGHQADDELPNDEHHAYLLRQPAQVDGQRSVGQHPGEPALIGGHIHDLEQVDIAEHADKLPSADEPMGNLDSKTADAVFRIFEDLVDQGRTIVMVTHDCDLAS
jgi:Fe-S cluster assembly ATPase SufC